MLRSAVKLLSLASNKSSRINQKSIVRLFHQESLFKFSSDNKQNTGKAE